MGERSTQSHSHNSIDSAPSSCSLTQGATVPGRPAAISAPPRVSQSVTHTALGGTHS